jgi:hypothetical protein
MEEFTMYNNEKTEAMEELQPRAVPQVSTPQPPPPPYPVVQNGGTTPPPPIMDIEGVEAQAREEEALTIKFAIGKLNDYLQWFMMVLEAILLIRFLLRMFGANPSNPFAFLIFSLTDFLLVPFQGLLPDISLHANQAFELSTLFAALIYFLIVFALKRFLRILISNPEEPVE